MSVSIEDLKPKSFTITVKGVELECQPLRLSDALIISKVGKVFENPTDVSNEKIAEAEQDMDNVISKLIPELKDVQLDMGSTLEVITQLMSNVEPTDNKELREKGVTFGDPKAKKS